MFGTWLTLRKLRDALAHGRWDEAYRLVNLPELKEHRRHSFLVRQVGQGFLTRAAKYVEGNNLDAAWKDLLRAEEAGMGEDLSTLRLRQELASRGVKEARLSDLTASYHGPAPVGTSGLACTARARPLVPTDETGMPRRLLLWIDGVGGYLVCLNDRVSVGQATPDGYVDIPLFADISRLHGYFIRDAEGYLLEAVRPTVVNQQKIDPQAGAWSETTPQFGKTLLRDGDRLTVGNCQLCFRQPAPVSATARLELSSKHRLPLALDGVLLMAETCVLGPSPQSHVVVPDLPQPVVLFRRKDGLGVRSAGGLMVDGQPSSDRAPLATRSTVVAGDCRFTLEPVAPDFGRGRA
jgi:hypothetical protein